MTVSSGVREPTLFVATVDFGVFPESPFFFAGDVRQPNAAQLHSIYKLL
jgi:hypothetical protein